MPQSSAPIVGVNLSDVDWRDAFGDEAGVLGDIDGTAYRLALPTDSDVVQVGSPSQRSVARVAGFVHRIPAGEAEAIPVPAASGSARTDIIALRYDPAFTGAPGPVRLVRIAGTSAGLPTYDDSAPGIEDLPLWSVARQPGQALSQATVRRLFPRLAPVRSLPDGAPLPLSSPLGTRLHQGSVEYMRELGAGGTPVWTPAGLAQNRRDLGLYGEFSNFGGTLMNISTWRESKTAFIVGSLKLNVDVSGLSKVPVSDVVPEWRPAGVVTAPTTHEGRFEVLTSGRVNLVNGSIVTIPAGILLPLSMVIPLT